MVTFRPRVFLVGAGGYGRVYLDALTKEDLGADLVGICDMRADLPERIPRLRERHIPVYPTLEAFYAAAHADLPFSPHRCTFMRRWRFPASPTVPMCCAKSRCASPSKRRAPWPKARHGRAAF